MLTKKKLSNVSTDSAAHSANCCVIIPFYDRIDQLCTCVNALIPERGATTTILLIDDGSMLDETQQKILQHLVKQSGAHLIQHSKNLGVAAARNSGLDWCRNNGMDLVIMLDSDCIPESNVISEHRRLHNQHPEATCIGGQIKGSGRGLWARLDGIISWVHASPHENNPNEFRRVQHPYHLATTNFSAKLSQLPQREFIFDERLATGEDCLLIRELRAQNKQCYFSATPTITHTDRIRMTDVFGHQYRWGHHQYFIQLGGNLSARCFNPFYRALFLPIFLLCLPFFALLGAALNLLPYLRSKPTYLAFYPLAWLIWVGKGLAVSEACVRPLSVLRNVRNTMTYNEREKPRRHPQPIHVG